MCPCEDVDLPAAGHVPDDAPSCRRWRSTSWRRVGVERHAVGPGAWPRSVCRSRPVAVSQILAVRSKLAEATVRPSRADGRRPRPRRCGREADRPALTNRLRKRHSQPRRSAGSSSRTCSAAADPAAAVRVLGQGDPLVVGRPAVREEVARLSPRALDLALKRLLGLPLLRAIRSLVWTSSSLTQSLAGRALRICRRSWLMIDVGVREHQDQEHRRTARWPPRRRRSGPAPRHFSRVDDPTGRARIGSPARTAEVLGQRLGARHTRCGILLQAFQADRLEVDRQPRLEPRRGLPARPIGPARGSRAPSAALNGGRPVSSS